MEKQKNKIIFSLVVSCLLFFGVINITNAASLYFSPSSGSYTLGQDFSVDVYTSSTDQSMNAVSGVISFPTDKLEVRSLSKSGSVITFWIQEPSFFNSIGSIDFKGVVLNPGFTGSAGKTITINFRTKAIGNSSLVFSSSSVLANDGLGSEILSSSGIANYNISTTKLEPKITTTSQVPVAPVINSSTHPDSDKWYAENTAKFNWKGGKDIIATRLLLDENSTSKPTIYYDKAITEKTVDDLEDGIWYFHAQLKNESGWSPTTHFEIKIDTEAPYSLKVNFVESRQTFDPSPSVFFTASDFTSGIDHYKISVDETNLVEVDSNISQTNPFVLPSQKPGNHTLFVEAYDQAGNSVTTLEEFVILRIEKPTITSYPSELKQGDVLIVEGETYPNSSVSIWIKDENEEVFSQQVRSSQDGLFSLIWKDKISKGIYELWAGVTDEKGAVSDVTEVLTISVETTFVVSDIILTVISFILMLSIILNIYFIKYKKNKHFNF